MARRLGPTPNLPQTTPDFHSSLDQLQRSLFNDLTELHDRAMQTLPKDGTERMTAPLPLGIFITAGLPAAADWEGSIVFDTTTNELKFSDGSSWLSVTSFATQLPAFRAVKNATQNVADVTQTAVTFQTEQFDIGGFFASSAWTPPSGNVVLTASIYATGTFAVGAVTELYIMKNGGQLSLNRYIAGSTTEVNAYVSTIDRANGTDVYTVELNPDTTGGNAVVQNDTRLTYFSGVRVSA